jgi:hypothetical protein
MGNQVTKHYQQQQQQNKDSVFIDHDVTVKNNNHNNNNNNKRDNEIVIVKDTLLPPTSSNTITTVASDADSLVSSISDPLSPSLDVSAHSFSSRHHHHKSLYVCRWDGVTYYGTMVQQGLEYLGKDASKVLMLYESPSSSSTETSFYNSQVFNYHDFPSFPAYYKSVLAPCRYSVMNGSVYPSYLRDPAPHGLIEHWQEALPNFEAPVFTPDITADTKVYAYLPVEHLNLDVSHVFVLRMVEY